MKEIRMSIKAVIPLVFGIVGIFGMVGYLCMIKDYKIPLVVDMCIMSSVISFSLGIIASIITRKYRKANNTLWCSGTIICIIGICIWILLIGILVALSLALKEI